MTHFKYSVLKQSVPSDDEDELGEDETVFDRKAAGQASRQPIIDLNLAGWSNEGNPTVRFQGRKRRTWLLVCVVIVILGGSVAAVLFPVLSSWGTLGNSTRSSADWLLRINDTGSETCVQLVDVDGDGLDDIIVGMASTHTGRVLKTMVAHERKSVRQACKELGEAYPCLGDLVALRGLDGKELWRTKTRSSVIFLNCHEVDVNKDGQMDCIVTGRVSTVQAIDPRTGKTLWVTEPEVKPWLAVFHPTWNTYQALALPDFTGDGIPEILIAHGGNPSIPPDVHEREAGRLIILSGASGKPLGTYLPMPDRKETYMSPVLYTAPDDSLYVLFGSGGETVPGDFFAISVPDLYNRVKQHAIHMVPGITVAGKYKNWQEKKNHSTDLITIYKGQGKGVMVPPLVIDVTGDGVDDILVSAYDGYLILFDGTDLQEVWRQKFPGMESYSSPAPGYFDDDDVVDFMMHWSHGTWPRYDLVVHVIISGKDGSILWQTQSAKNEMTSDLVLRTTELHRDAFVFSMRGRVGHSSPGSEAELSHGLTPQLPSKHSEGRQRRHLGGEESHNNESADDAVFNALSPEEAKAECEDIYKDFRNYHMECTEDLIIEREEMFLMDWYLSSAPIKLMETKAEKFHYELDYIEGNNHCHDVNPDTGKIDMCSVIIPDLQSTGAIGDVDGDGQPDLVKVGTKKGGYVTDRYSAFRDINNLIIRKVSIVDAVIRNDTVPLNVSGTHSALTAGEGSHPKLTFLPMSRQRWTSYLGPRPIGTYREP